MISRPDITSLKLALLLAVALALTAIGFAHRTGPASADPALTAFLADGHTLSEICGAPEDPDHAAAQRCEACRLVGAAVLPENDARLLVLPLENGTAVAVMAAPALRAARRDPAYGARAPPLA